MTDFRLRHVSFGQMLQAMQWHQQGHHGWRLLHETLAHLHETDMPALTRLLVTCWQARPHISDAHLVTLLGVAVRELALRDPAIASVFDPAHQIGTRARALGQALTSHQRHVTEAVLGHSNSFTGARRFLLPQLLIGHFARRQGLAEVRFLDLGTGLGVLPRQLNHRDIFDRFAADLSWRDGAPEYLEIPLTLRHGVDAHPLPTLEWVRTCHGPSRYYELRFDELLWAWDATLDVADQVRIEELNVLDSPAVGDYLRRHRINVVSASFLLYQYDMLTRRRVISSIVRHLDGEGLFLSMEPSHELIRMGCRVEAHLAGSQTVLHVADVSDAHFIGEVIPGPDLALLIGEQERRAA